jgi:hypothetical protein
MKVIRSFGENLTSIRRVEEYTKEETSVKADGKQSTSVDFGLNTWLYIAEYKNLQLY